MVTHIYVHMRLKEKLGANPTRSRHCDEHVLSVRKPAIMKAYASYVDIGDVRTNQ